MIVKVTNDVAKAKATSKQCVIFSDDVEIYLDSLPEKPIFDLVITSPPYDIGKEYEKKMPIDEYIEWQKRILTKICLRLKDTGSICWEVGNIIQNGIVMPLDYEFAPIFNQLGLQLRNRIVWHFGHGLQCKKRFSGRYEVILWYTKSDNYIFNLDPVRIPAKYPGKRAYKGPNKGKLSGNPLGKNPEDVWDIPNVKGRHVEKTDHPCQLPVGLVERLVLALSDENGLVFDPFSGVSSTGVAALLHNRKYIGCELEKRYIEIGEERLKNTINGTVKYRPFDKPIFDACASNLSKIPDEWKKEEKENENADIQPQKRRKNCS